MFYRIMSAAPGYPPEEPYWIAKYATLEYTSCLGSVLNSQGTRGFHTLHDARSALPNGAVQLPFQRDHQFIELWETLSESERQSPTTTDPLKLNSN